MRSWAGTVLGVYSVSWILTTFSLKVRVSFVTWWICPRLPAGQKSSSAMAFSPKTKPKSLRAVVALFLLCSRKQSPKLFFLGATAFPTVEEDYSCGFQDQLLADMHGLLISWGWPQSGNCADISLPQSSLTFPRQYSLRGQGGFARLVSGNSCLGKLSSLLLDKAMW